MASGPGGWPGKRAAATGSSPVLLPAPAGRTAPKGADFLVVGAGIAGAVAARALAEAGLRVTVIARGTGASHAPVAVVNPVRAKRGRPVPEAGAALEAAARLYRRYVPLRFGLTHRVPPEARPGWRARLAESGLPHRWRGGALLLPTAFWLRPRRLLAGLLAGLPRVRARVVFLEPGGVWLDDGRFLAGAVVWAGGAEGAGVLPGGRLTAGSLLLVAEPGDGRIAGVFHAGGAVGGSYRPLVRFSEPTPTAGELAELRAAARALMGRPPTVLGAWSAVRYRRAVPLEEIPGGFLFSGFGSTGFLMAPLWARRLLARI